MDLEQLIADGLAGKRRAIARLISMAEDGGPELGEIMSSLYPHTGRAYSVGITGAPGAGKSTLTEKLVGRVRRDDEKVAVLAIDPTSPFSGGALLGDRVRMQSHATDPDVFIRSMATRGHLGGLSLATPEAVRVLDAAGMDVVLIETVGVGQAEVEIADACDSTLVVLTPGFGDSVQAAKAGLLEIADVFVVNKSDRDGARDAMRELRSMLEMGEAERKPEIVLTSATKGDGIDELWDAIEKHRAYQEERGLLKKRRRKRIERELREIVAARFRDLVDEGSSDLLREMVDKVVAREIDPYAAADGLVTSLSPPRDENAASG
jgi:LAO/AO transport system kinase